MILLIFIYQLVIKKYRKWSTYTWFFKDKIIKQLVININKLIKNEKTIHFNIKILLFKKI